MRKKISQLVQLSMTLKQALKSMDKYGHKLLHNNEALTRYVLIDPVLRALGWNTEDPKYVLVEFSMEEAGKPDYTLMRAGKVEAIVEAKCWGTISRLNKKISKAGVIDSKEIQKLNNYCTHNNADIDILTDGGAWWIFDFKKRKPSEAIMKIDFADVEEDDDELTDFAKKFSILTKNEISTLIFNN